MMTFHDRLREHARFEGWLLAETALHAGTGQPSEGTDAGVVRDFYQRPLIPGSSLKGAIRSAVERRVEWLGPDFSSCRLETGAACLSMDKKAYDLHRLPEANEKKNAPAHYQRRLKEIADPSLLCDTCRVFGSRVFGGKVQFDDLPLTEEFEVYGTSLIEVRDGVGIDRDSGTAVPQIKFDYEVVPSLTAFRLHATAENLDEKDWKLLALGLLELMDGNVAVGGKSTRGLGRCRLELRRLRYVEFPEKDPYQALPRLLQHLSRAKELEQPDPRAFLIERLAGKAGD
ncbi:MAG: type III CRISPR-associated RAMP protein Csx7 [Actinomycetota bacterium]